MLWGNPKERDHLKEKSADGKMILKLILEEIGWEDVDRTDFFQDREKSLALVKTVMNTGVS
jgi:hypothetical protein